MSSPSLLSLSPRRLHGLSLPTSPHRTGCNGVSTKKRHLARANLMETCLWFNPSLSCYPPVTVSQLLHLFTGMLNLH